MFVYRRDIDIVHSVCTSRDYGLTTFRLIIKELQFFYYHYYNFFIDKVHQQCDFLDSQTFSSEALTENFEQNVWIWKGKHPISLFNC